MESENDARFSSHAQRATNVVWHANQVVRADRQRCLGQHGATLWFTGLSGSGKSTIAFAVERMLFDRGRAAYVLDGDNLRLGLNKNLGFSLDNRAENVRRTGEVAKLFADSGLIVVGSLISPYLMDRATIRDLHVQEGLPFIEVFIDTPIEICEARDPKGLYKRARAGEIPSFTGIDDPYEPPENPEVHLRGDCGSPSQCADVVWRYLLQRGICY
jgi:adenylylsulfate kinase